MATFGNGMQMGMQAVQYGVNRADRQRQQETDNTRQEKLDQDALLTRALDRKRMDRMEQQFNVEMEEKKAEMARFVEASAAFDKFSAAAGVLDAGNPAALDQYATVTKQYLPTILKHEGIAKKWEATDRVFKQGQAFTIKKLADTATLQAMEEAARLAPEVMLNPPKLPDGTPDYAAIRAVIEDRRREMEEQAVKLRRASVDARAEAEASGAYGGKTAAKPTMGAGTKAELDAVADELRTVNKALVEPKLTPERKLELVNRKSTLQRRLRSFDSMGSPEAAPAAESPKAPSAGQSRSIKVGGTVWQLNVRE